jgi:signal transduction histidine kinase
MPLNINTKKITIFILIVFFILISFEVNERFFYAIEKSKDEAIEGTTKSLLQEVIWNDNEFRDNLRKFLDGIRKEFKTGDGPAAVKEKYGAREVFFIAPDATITATGSGEGAGARLNSHFQCNQVVSGKVEYHYFGINPDVHCEKDVFGISFAAGDKTVRVTFELKKLEKFFNRDKLKTLIRNIARSQSMEAVVLRGAEGGQLACWPENKDADKKGCVEKEYIIQLNGLSLLKMTACLKADPLSALKRQSKLVYSIIIFLFLTAYLLIERYSRLKSSMESLKSDYSNLSEFSFRALSAFPFPAVIIGDDDKIRPLNHAGEALLDLNEKSLAAAELQNPADARGPAYPSLPLSETRLFKDNGDLAGFIETSKGFNQAELLIKTAPSSFRPYRCQLVKAGGMALLLFIDTAGEKKREMQIGINSEHNMAALFLAKLAHELRNPLNAVSMSLQMAKNIPCEGEYKSQAAGRIDFCLEELERLNRIIKNYLGRRPMEIELKKVDINEIVLYASSIIKNYITDGGYSEKVGLSVDVNRSSVMVNGNNDLLIQAFYNVMINSVQAAAENAVKAPGGKGFIKIEQIACDKSVTVTITDNGGGIAADARDKIFEIGYSTKKEGSGLGLAIVSEIVSRHGGVIDISSAGGTTAARITFPIIYGGTI